jgi:hypothetical protein
MDRLQESIEQNVTNASFKLDKAGARALASMIEVHLEAHGLTVKKFADRGKLNDTFVSTFKRGGASGMTVGTMLKFAKAFDMPVMLFAEKVFKRAPLVKTVDVQAEIMTPADVKEQMTRENIAISVNGMQLLARQVGKNAEPLIVEHCGWVTTLIPT